MLTAFAEGPVEGRDPQVLRDPREEQLHLPARLVELGDGQGRQRDVVGEEDQALAGIGVGIANAPEWERVQRGGPGSREHDGLIAPNPGGLVDRMRIAPRELQIGLGPGHEECVRLVEPVETGEVEIAAVHHIACPREGEE